MIASRIMQKSARRMRSRRGIALLVGALIFGMPASHAVAQTAAPDIAADRCAARSRPHSLKVGDATGGTLVAGESDRWRPVPFRKNGVSIRISPVFGKRGLPSVLVCDPTGRVIRQRRGEQSDEINLRLEPAEMAVSSTTLVIWNEGRSRLEYNLDMRSAEPFDTTPKHIEIGDDDKARLLPETALLSRSGRPFAHYAFQLADRTRTRIFVSSDMVDPRVELWLDNVKIAEDEDSGGGFNALIVRDLAPGSYLLRVETTDSGEGEFKVKLSRAASLRDAAEPFTLVPNVPLTDQKLDQESPILDALTGTSGELVTSSRGCAVAMAGRPYALYRLTAAPGEVADITVESAPHPGSSCPLLTEAGVDSPQGFISFRQSLDGILRNIAFDKGGEFIIRVSADDPSPRTFTITARVRPR